MLEQPQKMNSTKAVKMNLSWGQSARKSWYYLLGVYLGDGCVTNCRGYMAFRLNTIDMDFAVSVKNSLKNLTERQITIHTYSVKKSSNLNHALYCGDGFLCELLKADTESKAKIPDYVFSATGEDKKSFISGLMDSEGFVSRVKSGRGMHFFLGYKSCDKWVYDFIKILQSVGVKIGKVREEKPLKEWYKIPIKFGIKLSSWVDSGCHFNILRKENRVIDWINNYRFYVRRPDYLQRLHVENGQMAVMI